MPKETFKQAFRAARDAGVRYFYWEGKKYKQSELLSEAGLMKADKLAESTGRETDKTREDQQNLHWSHFYIHTDIVNEVSKFYRRDIDILNYNNNEKELLVKVMNYEQI